MALITKEQIKADITLLEDKMKDASKKVQPKLVALRTKLFQAIAILDNDISEHVLLSMLQKNRNKLSRYNERRKAISRAEKQLVSNLNQEYNIDTVLIQVDLLNYILLENKYLLCGALPSHSSVA